jgi:hypothetical protein
VYGCPAIGCNASGVKHVTGLGASCAKAVEEKPTAKIARMRIKSCFFIVVNFKSL